MNIIKKNFKYIDKVLLFTTLLLFTIGLLNIVTASSREAVVRYGASLYHYFNKQLIMIIIGLVLSFFIIMIKPSIYKKNIKYLFYIILGICIFLLFNGKELKGAVNWINIPIINMAIQPSEFAKVIIIIYLAVLFEKHEKHLITKNDKLVLCIAKILFVGLLIPCIVFFQKDFGTMLIMLTIFFIMFISSPILKEYKLKVVLLLIALTLSIGGFMMLKRGYIFTDAQMKRFDFLAPCLKYETVGYQVCNGYIAINNGGLLGLGIGKSKQIYSYIPEPHTDSVFAIIAEEMGVLKCSIIFILYIIILYRILKISMNSKMVSSKFICIGVSIYIFMHIFLNLGGLLGVIPLTGVPLPFLSYGGSYTITLMCALAFVQNININNKKNK